MNYDRIAIISYKNMFYNVRFNIYSVQIRKLFRARQLNAVVYNLRFESGQSGKIKNSIRVKSFPEE